MTKRFDEEHVWLLNLSKRTKKVLLSHDIETVFDLRTMSLPVLAALSFVGSATIAEICEEFVRLGIPLKPDWELHRREAALRAQKRKRHARVPKCPNCGIHGHNHSCIDTASP